MKTIFGLFEFGFRIIFGVFDLAITALAGVLRLFTRLFLECRPKPKKRQDIDTSLYKYVPKEKTEADITLENMSGYDFERLVAYKLKEAGYTDVKVTPKSGDFGADIIAYSNGMKVCVQCKKYSKPVGVKAVQEVIAAMSYYNCEAAAVVSTGAYTEQAWDLARRAGVSLMTIYDVRNIFGEAKPISIDEMAFYDMMEDE